ncbi:MAG: hypothetical protein K8I02_04125 [Candidatus Methylomirabilis sp.]|nr:hypothetical protein [Deltaproteobacteria bacterium]
MAVRFGASPLALAALVLLGLLSAGATQCGIDGPGEVKAPTPVLFVHGLGGERSQSFAQAREWLWDNGYEGHELREIHLSNSYGCIEQSAREVAVAAAQLLADTGAEQLDLVGHSLGGLVGRYFIKNLGGTRVVRTFVSITSPQHGTFTITPSPLNSCSMNQMMVGSPFLAALNAGDETPDSERIRYLTIRGLNDLLVTPNTSPMLAGAVNLDMALGTWLDHYYVLYLAQGLSLLREALGDPDAS